ncbi:MAG: DUF3307 domain-containing protein [Candidatus Promineifilaceae bacterium]|jgi:hypothetical protein
MILAMILAHLVGDFILQTDRIAAWKSQTLKGVFIHGLIVFAVTAAFALPFPPFWWEGVIFISIAHTVIDGAQFLRRPHLTPVVRFFLDQFLHFMVIFAALGFGGYLAGVEKPTELSQLQVSLLYAVGYAFVTMPTWVLLKFVGYWLLERSAPVFPDAFNKYAGIVERILIVTFVLTGQFLLVPLLAIPRVILERRNLAENDRRPLYLFETLGGIALAIGVGLLLRQI